jgi:hypothetical protein
VCGIDIASQRASQRNIGAPTTRGSLSSNWLHTHRSDVKSAASHRTLPAGQTVEREPSSWQPPPAADRFADVEVVHAIDGDGTSLCGAGTSLVQIDSFTWPDVPRLQRCGACEALLLPWS